MANADGTVVLGIDIGGSGIKGAPVDIESGALTADRLRIPTPTPSSPEAVAEVVARIVEHFDYEGPVGCAFPAVIRRGVACSAANVDGAWIGTDAAGLFRQVTGQPVHVFNDADGAGVGEMAFGAGRCERGVVLMLTLGTGIGSALFIDRKLVPNTELGHLELNGRRAEPWAAARARKSEKLSWKRWGRRVRKYLCHLEFLFSPALFIIGGGMSRRSEKFFPYLKLDTPITPAQLANEAGIVGVAYAASRPESFDDRGRPALSALPQAL
ncbi:MAG: ROK family protein [Truepera sp.]|nr:ROK family protein [Truepera sp.]